MNVDNAVFKVCPRTRGLQMPCNLVPHTWKQLDRRFPKFDDDHNNLYDAAKTSFRAKINFKTSNRKKNWVTRLEKIYFIFCIENNITKPMSCEKVIKDHHFFLKMRIWKYVETHSFGYLIHKYYLPTIFSKMVLGVGNKTVNRHR